MDRESGAENYESYCMDESASMDDFDMTMMGYDVMMSCSKDMDRKMKDSAIKVASGFISAAVLISTLYWYWGHPNNKSKTKITKIK